MHILLTDILTCPRCGPEFGLILLADEVVSRRVQRGVLGCANCREKYAVTAGVGEFGREAGDELRATAGGRREAGDVLRDGGAYRLAALMGVTEGPGYLVLGGEVAAHADAVAELVAGVEVVAVNGPPGGRQWSGDGGVSHVRVRGPRLPLGSGRAAGIAIDGASAEALLEEYVRTLSPVGRFVVAGAAPDTSARLSAAGLTVLAQEGGTVVAGRVHR